MRAPCYIVLQHELRECLNYGPFDYDYDDPELAAACGQLRMAQGAISKRLAALAKGGTCKCESCIDDRLHDALTALGD